MFLLWFPGINQIISKNQTQDKHPVNFSRKNKEKTMLRDTKNIIQVKTKLMQFSVKIVHIFPKDST